MGHRAPGICVPPGPAAAHSTGSRGRTSRVAGARARIGALVEPVGTPLVTHAREVGEAKAIGGGPPDLWGPREALVRTRVPPRIAGALEVASGGAFPLRLARETAADPRGEAGCLLPGETDHRLVGIGEGRLTPEAGRRNAGRGQIDCEVGVGGRGARHLKRSEEHTSELQSL